MSRETLLAHVVSAFTPREWENVASESLRFLLTRPGGNQAINNLLAPLGFTISGETWKGQVTSSNDTSIPDLVAEVEGRHKLIIEAKFWAALTPNQPVGYLARQTSQFESTSQSLLVFLAPSGRRHLLTAELEERLSTRHHDVGSIAVIDSDLGRVAFVSWGDMLGHLRASFHALADEDSIGDLEQLVGLCDRADQVAMLPLAAEEVDSRRAHRHIEFQRVIRAVVEHLVANHGFSVQGFRESGTFDGWGRGVRNPLGQAMGLSVWLPGWAESWPTPWWLRIWDPERRLDAWIGIAGTDPGVGLAHHNGTFAEVGLRAPLGVEEQRIVQMLSDTVARICLKLPQPVADETGEPPPESL